MGKKQKKSSNNKLSNKQQPYDKYAAIPSSLFVWAVVAAFCVFACIYASRTQKDGGTDKRKSNTELNDIMYLTRLLQAGQVKDAVKGAEQAAIVYPASGKVALLLAITYATDKNYTAALAAFVRAKDMTTDSGEDQSKCLTWIGVCHRRLGRTQEAFQYLHWAVEKTDNNSNNNIAPGHENYFHLAQSYLMDNQHRTGDIYPAEI